MNSLMEMRLFICKICILLFVYSRYRICASLTLKIIQHYMLGQIKINKNLFCTTILSRNIHLPAAFSQR